MEWTPTDATKAAREGWSYQNGYVRHLFQSSQFHSPWQVVEHLRERGRKSEWHRNIYISLPWTEADDRLARMDGWRFTQGSIIRITNRFTSDEEAQQFVLEDASTNHPDPLCMKALARLAKLRLLAI